VIIRTCEVGCLVVLSNRRRPDEVRTVPPCCRNDDRTVTVSQKLPLGDFTLFFTPAGRRDVSPERTVPAGDAVAGLRNEKRCAKIRN